MPIPAAAAAWYLHDRRRAAVLCVLSVLGIGWVSFLYVASLNTIRIQNNSEQWLAELIFEERGTRWGFTALVLINVPPDVDFEIYFRRLEFRGPMSVQVRLADESEMITGPRGVRLPDGRLLPYAWDPDRYATSFSLSDPAPFFRTYLHVHVTEEGEVEVHTRRSDD